MCGVILVVISVGGGRGDDGAKQSLLFGSDLRSEALH
jgi:hypothetical protein